MPNRQKLRQPETEIDRLSSLPETVLLDILVCLNNTEEAIKTAVLSKQWRFLWTKLPSLAFWSSTDDPGRIERFVAGVHSVFGDRTELPLERFSIFYFHYYDKRYASDIDAWLGSAAESKVKYVNLHLYPIHHEILRSDRYTLPQAIYSHSPLTALELGHCNLAPPAAAVEWRSLTLLTISDSYLSQRAVDAIASGCPALRCLELHNCAGFNRLEIGGRRFHRLEIQSCDDCGGGDETLVILAPHMRDLDVWMDPSKRSLRLTDVPSLEKARIDFSIDLPEGVSGPFSRSRWNRRLRNNEKLFEKILLVRSLVLGHGWIRKEVPSMMREEGWRFPESRVEELEIEDSLTAHNFHAVLAILESSPFLDTLIIREKEVMLWDPTVHADLNHDLSLLKNVRIEIYSPGLCSKQPFTLAQILLKRAPLLERMVICKKITYNRNFPRAASDELNKKFEALLVYPRSSQKAVVELIDIGRY